MCRYILFFQRGLLLALLIITFNCHAALKDPTRPAGFDPYAIAATASKGLSLDAIFYSPQEQRAIINGQTLHQGDSIAGFRLLQIKPQAVVLKGPNGIIELPLFTLNIKRTVTDGVDTQ